MKPAAFQYHAPATVDEAVALLARHATDDARILAGGQSLVPAMNLRLARPAHLVDINQVAGLDHIAVAGSELVIGACVRHAAFETPVCDGPLGVLLARVASHIAHWPIRVRGTFCGSLAQADPASEWCLVAATLNALVDVVSAAGRRTIPARDLLAGVMTTTLRPDELIIAARLPLLPGDTRWGFREFSRRAGDYALGMALVCYSLERGCMHDVRVGIGGAEVIPRRPADVEAMLEGKAPAADLFRKAGDQAGLTIDPLVDHHASAEYRRELVSVMVRRALADAAA